MTITLYKTGIMVTNATAEEREEIINNYGNGKEWKKIEDDKYVLMGLFGVAQVIIDEYILNSLW